MKNKFFAAHTKNLKARTVWLKKDTNSKKIVRRKEDDYENSISK